MKLCPECQTTLIERKGEYVRPGVRIENASWLTCPTCGHEEIPKALKKAIKRVKR